MSQRTIGCEEAVQLLAAYLDRELEPDDDDALARHLEACQSCYSRTEFEKRLKLELVQLRRAPVGPALEGRVRSILHHFGPAPRHPAQDGHPPQEA